MGQEANIPQQRQTEAHAQETRIEPLTAPVDTLVSREVESGAAQLQARQVDTRVTELQSSVEALVEQETGLRESTLTLQRQVEDFRNEYAKLEAETKEKQSAISSLRDELHRTEGERERGELSLLTLREEHHTLSAQRQEWQDLETRRAISEAHATEHQDAISALNKTLHSEQQRLLACGQELLREQQEVEEHTARLRAAREEQ